MTPALNEFGPFQSLFEPTVDSVPGYLVLLNLCGNAAGVIQQLEAAMLASGPDLGEHLSNLLGQANWRIQLVGAAAYFVAAQSRALPLKPLWAALDRPCWTSPQLAAAASVADPDFIDQARLRINRRCQLNSSEAKDTLWLARHSELGPGSVDAHDPKLLSALVALCEAHPTGTTWLDSITAAPDIRAMLESDVDQGGQIAMGWRQGMQLLIQNGVV